MKIGIFNPYIDSLSGGERYMLTIASCLQNNHIVSIFWDDQSILKKAEERLKINLQKVNVVPNIFLSSNIKIISSYLKTKKYDLIIILSDGSIPLIFTKGIIHFQQPFIDIGRLSFLNKIKLLRYKSIICNSKFTKKYIDKVYNINSKVIYPPVDTKKFSPSEKQNKIITIGRFHPVKKHVVLIDIFKRWYKKHPEYTFAIVGSVLPSDEKYLSNLKKIANNIPVEFYVNEPFSVVKKLLSSSLLYWHAAGYGEDEQIHPERFEHFGISPVEAMASGCIPFVYKGGGLPEIVDDGKNGYIWEKKEELLTLAEMVTQDKRIIQKLSKNAQEKSKVFDKVKFCNKINRLLI